LRAIQIDELGVEVAAACAGCWLGVEPWLGAAGEQALHFSLGGPVVAVPGSDPHPAMTAAGNPAWLLGRVEFMDDGDDDRLTVNDAFVDL
jgi:hypothetical protein